MLPQEMGGVVDANLRVYGVFNLRVIDASVFPIEWSAHMMAPTYGLAEKAAEIIAADYSSPSGLNSNDGNSNGNGNGDGDSNGQSKGDGVRVTICPVLSIFTILLGAIMVTL